MRESGYLGQHYQPLSPIRELLHRIQHPPRPGAIVPHVQGIDVSHWQGDLTQAWWDQAYSEGYKFAFLKCTEEVKFLDERYEQNRVRARKAGLKVGAYHFFRPAYFGPDQANWLLANMGEVDLGVVCDLEVDDKATDTVINARVEAFFDRIRKEGHPLWLYSAAWFLDPRPKIDPAEPYYHWPAHWTTADTPYLPDIWEKDTPGWHLWQYSSTGKVAGKNPIDLNRMRLETWESFQTPEPPPPDPPAEKPVVRVAYDPERVTIELIEAGE